MPYDVDKMGIFSLLTSVVAAHRVLEQEGVSGKREQLLMIDVYD